MELIEQLKASRLFSGIDENDLRDLLALMARQHIPAGTVLFEKDAAGDAMYIILSGRVRIYLTDTNQREYTLRRYGPAQIFGEFSLLDQKPRSASAAALEDTEVLVLNRETFLDFIPKRPQVGLAMMDTLVDRVRYTTTFLQGFVNALHELARGEYEQAMQMIPPTATDAEIQELIGIALQAVQEMQAREQTLRRQHPTPDDNV